MPILISSWTQMRQSAQSTNVNFWNQIANHHTETLHWRSMTPLSKSLLPSTNHTATTTSIAYNVQMVMSQNQVKLLTTAHLESIFQIFVLLLWQQRHHINPQTLSPLTKPWEAVKYLQMIPSQNSSTTKIVPTVQFTHADYINMMLQMDSAMVQIVYQLVNSVLTKVPKLVLKVPKFNKILTIMASLNWWPWKMFQMALIKNSVSSANLIMLLPLTDQFK